MTDSTLGLRDRKRIQTRARMEKAAVDLVLKHGMHLATIDAICEEAEVSSRTFFNYFDSKEDAILGLSGIELTEEIVLEHIGTADVLESLVGLMVEIAIPALQDTTLHTSRTEVMHRYPELVSKHVARITSITDELLEAVRTLMLTDPRFSDSAGAASLLAEPILAMCSATVRISAKEWIAAGSDAPISTITTRAVALAREVVEKLR